MKSDKATRGVIFLQTQTLDSDSGSPAIMLTNINPIHCLCIFNHFHHP